MERPVAAALLASDGAREFRHLMIEFPDYKMGCRSIPTYGHSIMANVGPSTRRDLLQLWPVRVDFKPIIDMDRAPKTL